METELGVPFEDVYELMEPEPIAAASIGQVGTSSKGVSLRWMWWKLFVCRGAHASRELWLLGRQFCGFKFRVSPSKQA